MSAWLAKKIIFCDVTLQIWMLVALVIVMASIVFAWSTRR